MCTSAVIETMANQYILGRTMDFAFELEGEVIIIPRGFSLKTELASTKIVPTYGFVGTGRGAGNKYIFADGINEKGLSCASLYFPEYAVYNDVETDGMLNLAPHEMISFILSTFSTLAEVRTELKRINLVALKADLLGIVLPLHWIIMDKFGKSLVIEPTKNGIEIHENAIGIMTNSPDYKWHVTNLRNYIGIQPKQVESMTLFDTEFKPFSQGTGTRGLPGDYAPTSRFVRAFYAKVVALKSSCEIVAIHEAFHLFSSVDIPKGAVVTSEGTVDYTQYISCMSSANLTYYTQTYYVPQIKAIHLSEDALSSKQPLHFDVLSMENSILSLNK
ncbi:hypothetical protein AwErysi_06140 [Erysipelotrichaceae bacterium]|nr:hypothetical protein AwErysi_06140 [Erysipelotrichaceae bacterium]